MLAGECAEFYDYLYMQEEGASDAEQAVAAHLDAGRAEQARALAERAVAAAPNDPRMRALLLETLPPEALMQAFARMHPELTPSDHRRFAEAAPGYLREGLSGLVLEASFLASLAERAPHSALRDAVELPAESLAELAYVLLLSEGAAGTLAVVVEGGLAADAPRATLGIGARWEGAEGPVWAASLAEPTFARVRSLSHALHVQLATEGQAELTATMGARRLTWTLRSEAGRIWLHADSGRHNWASLSRDVALPLAHLPATRFPVPSLSLTLDEVTLARLGAELLALPQVHCTSSPTTLVCGAPESGPDALLQVLVALARVVAR